MPNIERKWSVEESLIEALRERFLEGLDDSTRELYHPADLERVKENDWFVTRYILHYDKSLDKALLMLEESLKWRKESGINTFTKGHLPKEYFTSRAVFAYNKDNIGNPIVVVRTKFHFKNEQKKKDQQMYFVYWVEKMIRESDWGIVTILFDCTDSGVSNLDLDMMRFIVHTFKKYYPWALGSFVVCNMPWVLAAAWKIIKSWVPEQYAGKVNFVDVASIRNFIDEDQLPLCLGGTCTKIYELKEGVEGDFDDDEMKILQKKQQNADNCSNIRKFV